jgi:hypothetical protein
MARRHVAHVDWKHLAFYGLVVAAVVLVGGMAIWSFIERQSLVIQPEPLPKVTVVTGDTNSRLAAGWVRLLNNAELNPTLVALDNFDPIDGVVVFCEIPEIEPRLARVLDEFVRRGGALAFVGNPPATRIGKFQIAAKPGQADPIIRISENASPVLARTTPGSTIGSEVLPVAFLEESPRMMIDARWAKSARAAVMHTEIDRGRYLWFGFDPEAVAEDVEVKLILRSAFRWASGQPVSDGAIGRPQAAKTLSPAARQQARENGFAFSVDRSPRANMFTVRMINRGGIRLPNPTVKVWLPSRVTKVALGGDFIMNRSVTLTGVPEEGACLISLPSLTRNEERILKLRIVETKPPRRPPVQIAAD